MSFRPLAGCGLFLRNTSAARRRCSFRPLAGCGLFRSSNPGTSDPRVSVPLRGVGCFPDHAGQADAGEGVSVPLRGVGCFYSCLQLLLLWLFPSPCGVWVVSAKLHILSGATGKRIVNSAVLLYHIGRWFINSKLRNCKVPCEAHKTAT